MKCTKCNAEIDNRTSCPFCQFKINTINYTAVETANIIFHEYGSDILLDPRRFLALFSDISPKLKEEKKYLMYALKEDIARFFLDPDPENQNFNINKIRNRLLDIMSEKSIDIVISILSTAFNNKRNDNNLNIKNDADKNKSILSSLILGFSIAPSADIKCNPFVKYTLLLDNSERIILLNNNLGFSTHKSINAGKHKLVLESVTDEKHNEIFLKCDPVFFETYSNFGEPSYCKFMNNKHLSKYQSSILGKIIIEELSNKDDEIKYHYSEDSPFNKDSESIKIYSNRRKQKNDQYNSKYKQINNTYNELTDLLTKYNNI